MKELTLKQLSSLEKVFLKPAPSGLEINKASALLGEEFSYQIAYTVNETCKVPVEIKVDSPISEYIMLRLAENVPSELPVYEHDYDDDYLRTEPGLFPDILYPLKGNIIEAKFSRWHSLWVTVNIPKSIPAGDYPITISFINEEYKINEKKMLMLKVIGAALPEQELIYTQWFRVDSIADFYRVPKYSNRHWELIEAFVKTAAFNGVNMMMIPMLARGQIVDIFYDGKEYNFDFTNLVRWINLCKRYNIKYFEAAHLFTSVGAKFAVNVEVFEKGEKILKFGKHTAANDIEYHKFLEQFLPALVETFRGEGVADRLWFHVSDEPRKEDEESYTYAKNVAYNILRKLDLKPLRFMDALSDYIFYQNGIIDHPVVTIDSLEPFIENNVPELWGYNCCGQHTLVSNRFMAMPSYRNRIIGFQIYKYNLQGFLHWGYNHYYSEAGELVNPFLVTDALSGWQSGDPFSVYPGENEPIESIRLKVFKEALQDVRAMKLLEEYAGRDAVIALLEEGTEKPLTFKEYPRNAEYLTNTRNKINMVIEEYVR